MSFFSLLFRNARITGTIRVEDLNTIETNVVYTTNVNLAIPFSLSDLPDIVVASDSTAAQGNNILNGSTSPDPVIFNLPTITQVINSGGDLGGPYTVTIPDSGASPPIATISFALPNTANEVFAGFGGNDTITAGIGDDVLLGDGLRPDEGGFDGADSLNGGDGNDVLVGGGGGDTLRGDNGDDFILGDYFLGLLDPDPNIPVNVSRRVYQDSGSASFLGSGGSFSATLNVVYTDSIDIGSGFKLGGADNIFGGAGNDIILSDIGNDTVDGESGNDVLLGGANSDSLSGGIGNDVIFGDSLSPNFYGLDGSDTLNGNEGDDFLVGGGLGDTLNGGDGNDILLGDYLLNFFSGSIRLDSSQTQITVPSNIPPIEGVPGDDEPATDITIQLLSVPAILSIGSGNDGADLLNGGNGDDIAFGDRGNDNINLDAGADVGVGMGGVDTINGGLGNDLIIGDFFSPNFQSAPIGTSPASPDGADTLNGDDGDDFILGGGAGDTINGGAGNDVVLGDYFLGLFDASIALDIGPLPPGFSAISSLPVGSGNEGNDIINGGSGNDFLVGDKGTDTLNGEQGEDFLLGGAGNDTISGGTEADILIGDLLAPNAYGADGIDSLSGDGGNDVLVGGGLGDTLLGGAGNDFILGDYWASLPINSPFVIPLSGGTSLDGIGALALNDAVALPNILLFIGSGNEGNDFIDAGDGDDFALGDRGEDTVLGGLGNDILLGGGDNDVLRGGAGDDIISGDYVLPQGTKIPLSPDIVESLGNFLDLPEAGELTIDLGPAGNDLLEGGAGNDTLLGDAGEDTATYENDPGPVNISLGNIFNPGVGSGFDGYFNFDTLISIENLIGSNFNDQLNGDANSNKIWGRNGDDQITGGGGNDFLYGEEGNDNINAGDGDDFVVGGKGSDFMDGGFGVDTTSYTESDFGVVVDLDIFNTGSGGSSFFNNFLGVGGGFSGDARGDTLLNFENIEGSMYEDQLYGNLVANRIDGLAGDDQIWGEGGDDTLNGGDGNDIIKGGEGNDTIDGGSGRDNLFGDAGNDFIYGGADFDELTGGDGNDRIFGEDGADRLFGGNGDDQLSGGNDNDSIYGGAGVDYLDGGSGNDLLSGNEGNDVLVGGAGSDTLQGGAGNDWIEGGLGADHHYGGTGKDLFVFSKDSITGERDGGFLGGITDGTSNTFFIAESNGAPYVAPGTFDTIYDFKNSGQWWEFGANIDQIGLRDGLRYQDLIFIGVSSVQGSSAVNSTLIGYSGNNEGFAPLVEIIGLTPDKFKPGDFVTV